MTEEIKNGLLLLDPTDDTHWTQKGEPAIDAVKGLTGITDLTRANITETWPNFNREGAKALMDDADADESGMAPIEDDAEAIDLNSPEQSTVVKDNIVGQSMTLDDALAMGREEINALDDESLNALFDNVNNIALEIESEIGKLRNLMRSVSSQHEVIHSVRNQRKPKTTHANNVAAYFAMQDKAKLQAIEAVEELVEKGVEPKIAKLTIDAKLGKRRLGKNNKAQRFLNKKV